MLYLFLGILCSVLIANLLMLFQRKQAQDIFVIFLGNYFVATLFSLYNAKSSMSIPRVGELLFAVLAGAMFLINFVVYNTNIRKNGLSLSVGVMRSAVVIPVLLSVWWFSDPLSLQAIMGITVLLLGFGMLSDRQKIGNLLWILLLFGITGLTDMSLKVYFELGKIDKNLFLFFLFAAAYFFSLFVIVGSKRKVSYVGILFGFALGIPNQLSSLFFLKGLDSVSATIAYPLVASGIVICSIISDRIFWKRAFNRKQSLAFLLLVAGIALINL